MRVGALVPFKCFTRAKRRLRGRYSSEEVEQLGRAMLGDVLEALAGADTLESFTVLTDDEEVASVAREQGAQVRLRQPDPGLNPAIDAADGALREAGFDASLVVLGDLPLLRAEDVDAVILAGQQAAVVIVPSSDGGTALLMRRPPQRIAACFGPESARRHDEAARQQGEIPVQLTRLGQDAALDLDTPEDAQRVLASGRTCRTRALLERLDS